MRKVIELTFPILSSFTNEIFSKERKEKNLLWSFPTGVNSSRTQRKKSMQHVIIQGHKRRKQIVHSLLPFTITLARFYFHSNQTSSSTVQSNYSFLFFSFLSMFTTHLCRIVCLLVRLRIDDFLEYCISRLIQIIPQLVLRIQSWCGREFRVRSDATIIIIDKNVEWILFDR